MVSSEQQAIFDAALLLTNVVDEPFVPTSPAEIERGNLAAAEKPILNLYAVSESARIIFATDFGRGCIVAASERFGLERYKDGPEELYDFHEVCLLWEDDDETQVAIDLTGKVIEISIHPSEPYEKRVKFEASKYPRWKARIIAGLAALTDAQVGV